MGHLQVQPGDLKSGFQRISKAQIFSTARCSSSHSISHNPLLLLPHFLIIPLLLLKLPTLRPSTFLQTSEPLFSSRTQKSPQQLQVSVQQSKKSVKHFCKLVYRTCFIISTARCSSSHSISHNPHGSSFFCVRFSLNFSYLCCLPRYEFLFIQSFHPVFVLSLCKFCLTNILQIHSCCNTFSILVRPPNRFMAQSDFRIILCKILCGNVWRNDDSVEDEACRCRG